jgi:hypothetical protein
MVVLIQEPRFVFKPRDIRLNQKEDHPALYTRIKNAAIPVIRRIGSDLYASAKTSLKTSLVISPLFLRVASIVQAGSLAAVGAAVLTAFVAYNIASTVLLFAYKFNAYLLERAPLRNSAIKSTLSNQINPSHIKVEENNFDFSEIPENIKIEDLLTFLNQSDFSSDQKSITRIKINKIIQHINQKIAFLGTPPAGTTKLDVFYDNIKNMLRFSIYQLIKEEKEFLEARGGVIPAAGSKDFNKYRVILDGKKRILMQMSDASDACGARWMGEALVLYTMQKPTASQSFDKAILNHLSLVRRDLLNQLIHNENNNDTHFYGAVMQRVGPAIGIPGSDLAVEHLRNLETSVVNRFIQNFTQLYSSKKILDEMKGLYKINQEFREQAYDWIQDQKGDWKQKEYQQKADALIGDLKKLASQKIDKEISKKEHIDLLFGFIEELKKAPEFLKENYLSKGSIKELFDQFLESDQFKPYFNEKLKKEAPFFKGRNLFGGHPQVLRSLFQTLIEEEDKNSKGALLTAIKDVLQGKENSFSASNSQEDIKLKNIKKLLQDQHLNDVEIRSVEEISKPDFKEKIERGFERERQREFLSEIVKEDESLSDVAWKWILIENNILTPNCL